MPAAFLLCIFKAVGAGGPSPPPQILADPLILPQPGGGGGGQIMTIIITCPPPGFADLPTALYMLGGCSLYSQTAQQIHIQILGCQA